ncbi:hypothetical protein ACFW1F_03870 [Streptomyces bungoensis]|uniref:hypothetical protein n=1 Tax=Streptomyces bungoensis TaxID=285568 RepID=UPI0036CC43FD
MQWTDENGGDPYGAAGYGYAYGQDAGAGPVGPAHLATTAWDAPVAPRGHGDVLTAFPPHPDAYGLPPRPDAYSLPPRPDAYGLPPRPDAYGLPPQPDAYGFPQQPGMYAVPPEPEPSDRPAPEPDTAEDEPVRPVFVDSSGRRQRHVLRAARLLVIPAGGYVALLVSTVLGGPTVSAPFVPQPQTAGPAPHRVTAPDPSSGTGRTKGGTGSAAHESSRPTATRTTTAPAARPAASTAPTAAPTATTTPAATTAPAPASSPRGHALGVSHKPAK